jgi:type II secretory pathway predicted ATPase ExeA
MTIDYRQRFGLTGHVFPQDASGESFFETPSYKKLQRSFALLGRDPGLGVLTGDVGVGKTSAVRNLCKTLPRPDYQVLYLCDTAVSPLDLYRQLAVELGVTPSHRRAQLWQDLKATMLALVDEKGIQPTLILDEAQHLSDRFLLDLSGFLNFAMDSRNLLVLWLVGQPGLRAVLRMNCHAALASRIVVRVQLEPLSERKLFLEFLAHGLKAAGAKSNLLSDSAAELLFRASHGMPRRAAALLRAALLLAHEQNKSFVDDSILEAVLDDQQEA